MHVFHFDVVGRSATKAHTGTWGDAPNGVMARLSRAVIATGAVAAMVLAGFAVAPAAVADTAPIDPTSPSSPPTVSADGLPTVQIDGVAWQQVVVGNTVYVAGDFQTARPAGAAAGTNTVSRKNILAYDIRTGNLITGFAPVLNAQARTITASPDGSRIYVGGAFTQVNGTAAYRIAALNPTTGALITSFLPQPNATVTSLIATDTTVFAGGWFSGVGSTSRGNLAAFRSTDGGLLPWNPISTGGTVEAMALSPDKSKVVVGGSFTQLNGSANPGYGMGIVDATTGLMKAFPANTLVRNAGTKAAILSLTTGGNQIYGTGYVFGAGGNLEGTFSANWSDGAIKWVEDCHGDTYSVYPGSQAVYVAGHPHFCGTVGGFPQTSPTWEFYRGIAFTPAATGTLGTNPYSGYYNFAGTPAPTLLNWFPDMDEGSYTGAYQGPWTVQGNDDYVVYGGEFLHVNGVAQQGLVRYAKAASAPNKQGPMVTGGAQNPTITSFAAGTARVSWKQNWDRDNATLRYDVIRDGDNSNPVYTTNTTVNFWNRGTSAFLDTGLVPGSTHGYRIFVTDAFGNQARSDTVNITVAATGALSNYATDVFNDGASSYWRFGESSGTTVTDWAGTSNLTTSSGVTRGASGAITGDSDKASTFSGTSSGLARTTVAVPGPNVFTAEAWIKTTTTRGGKILGFGASSTGNSSSYDRQIYMANNGTLYFGVYNGAAQTLATTTAYNDGAWHHIAASLSPDGMVLYVDGNRVGQRSDVVAGQSYNGYWRVGGDNLSSWPAAPTSSYINGVIDEVAIYPTALTLVQLRKHYADSGRTAPAAVAPADAYGKAVFEDSPALYWRLGEASGTVAADAGTQNYPGQYNAGVVLGRPGAISGLSNTAASFNGTTGLLSSTNSFTNPQPYTEELWFNSTSTTGGALIGLGDKRTGLSTNTDRQVYMLANGSLVFTVNPVPRAVITTADGYNDGLWHHLVATQSADGMKLYVDGVVAASGPVASAQQFFGYWRVGGDSNAGPSPYFNGTIDEVAVYAKALTAQEVADHFEKGANVVPNQPPVAAFTATPNNLAVAFTAASSSDPDGTIASYSWNFGDGTAAGTGVTVTHSYAAAGSYQAILKVTDNKGTSTSLTKTVIVTAAPPANQPPVAAFTATPSNLTVALDATTSSDPDGTIASYSWDFGDGTAAGTGATVSHSYAAADSYQVILTVKDNSGAETSLTKTVVTTAVPPTDVVASDAFNRTVANGLGNADVGGPWAIDTGRASSYSVAAGAASVINAPGVQPNMNLNQVSANSTDSTLLFSLNNIPGGGGMYVSVQGRVVGGSNDYRAKLAMYPDGTVGLMISRYVNGAESILSGTGIQGLTYAAGTKLQVRLVVTGTSPTSITAKVWKDGTPEPTAWQLSITDSTAALQTNGGIGMLSYLSGSAAASTTIKYENLKVVAVP